MNSAMPNGADAALPPPAPAPVAAVTAADAGGNGVANDAAAPTAPAATAVAAAPPLGFATRAIHVGCPPDAGSGAVVPPISLSSTFAMPGLVKKDHMYSRLSNPNRDGFEACLASLEGGKYGFAFSSGQAATVTMMHTLKAGDHIVSIDDVYAGTQQYFTRIATPMGLNFTFCDMSAPGALAAAIRPTTRLVWLETPTNPTMKITSIEVVAAAAHAVGAVLVVDNTFASPYLQSPLALGADVVFHSVSKYIGGHSDLVMGALVTSDEVLATRLRHLQVNMGGVPSPFDCFLASRGMKTLSLRMAAHGANGAAVAAVVEAHPAVRRVLYPGLPSHPSYDIAVAQMRGGGGMMTFWLDGGLPAARAFLGALSVVTLAVSLGGVESLVEHPALMTHAALPPAVRAELGIDDGMVRLSVGIEDAEDLVRDISQALDAAKVVIDAAATAASPAMATDTVHDKPVVVGVKRPHE
ncbi:hypothetical protein MMPV_002628 [Pyropia vietnamensis]